MHDVWTWFPLPPTLHPTHRTAVSNVIYCTCTVKLVGWQRLLTHLKPNKNNRLFINIRICLIWWRSAIRNIYFMKPNKRVLYIHIYIYIYTECPRRNVPDFGRVFLMLKYTNITQNTYVQSWTVTEIMAREKCDLLAGPRTEPVSWQSYLCYIVECGDIWRQFSSRQP